MEGKKLDTPHTNTPQSVRPWVKVTNACCLEREEGLGAVAHTWIPSGSGWGLRVPGAQAFLGQQHSKGGGEIG